MDNSLLTTHTKSLKILIVEDSPIVQKAEKSVLEPFGFEIEVAGSGEKAITLFEPGKYAMVLLDIGLPGINGYEVCKRFIQMEKGTSFHTPIIGLSAHTFSDSEEKDLGLAAGMQEMLSKPLMFEHAQSLLQRYDIFK